MGTKRIRRAVVARAVLLALVAATVTVVVPAAPGGADGNEAPENPAAFREISAGDYHTCAILTNGTVKCWGINFQGQLGLGDTESRGDGPGEMGDNLATVDLGTGRTALSITTGNAHTCAVLDNGTVKCWGDNPQGQLGLGDTAGRGDDPEEMGSRLPVVSLGTGRTAVAISAGGIHTSALVDNGAVKCWGYNAQGQLGLGDTNARGDGLGEMGDNLPAVNLGTGRTATAIDAGGGHTCATLDNGALKCWGENSHGQLGLGWSGVGRGYAPGQMGNNLPAVNLSGHSATAISADGGPEGFSDTCALLDSGAVVCWGDNDWGELGQGHRYDWAGLPPESPSDINEFRVDLGTGRTATGITSGTYRTCALLDNATVKCWGAGSFLGLGDTEGRGDGPGEMGDNLPAVDLGLGRSATSVTTGDGHACARLDNGTVKCWGRNFVGQLGLGDTNNRGDGPGEMGDNLPVVDLGTAPGPGTVSGTVTESGSGAPVGGAWVAVLRTTDFSVAGGAATNGSGDYGATLPAGSYYLYLIDPTGAHTSSFFGPPTTVTVTAGNTADADPVLAPTRGSVTGTIIEDGTATPVGGAWAIGINASTGAPETGALANGSGQYTLPGLAAGNHLMVYVDPAGGHVSEFFANSSDAAHANPVAVTAGGSVVANDSMATQTPNPGGSTLSGTVTETTTNTALSGVAVMALRAADYRMAKATFTNGSGQYNLDLQAGAYKLVFLDGTGGHNTEWHNNHPYYGLADADSVTAPAVTNAVLDLNTGTMAGTITDDPATTPIAGAWVIAIGPSGIAGGATTAANGTYTIAGLPPGTYRAAFIDPTGTHVLEYYNNAPSYAGATTFNITAANTATVNATLAHL